MALKDDLFTEVKKIFQGRWSERKGQLVPEPKDLLLGNDGVALNATVLYADMNGSTKLVDSHDAAFAAEVYKSYLACAARIIKDEGGSVTAYDGDRIMGVFIGDWKNTTAVRSALKINWAVNNIVNPGIAEVYGNEKYTMAHVVGVDTSSLLASRIGVRNDNDLVWVGRAANYAAKLCALNVGGPVFITDDVFNVMNDTVKFNGSNKTPMWTKWTWTAMNKMQIYNSVWKWPLK